MKRIHFDNAATTCVREEVLAAMQPYFNEKYGNASSLHSYGKEARKDLEEARKKLANLLGVDSEEIVFTSGGTESNNFALKGIAFANKDKGKHIIISSIEHPSILKIGEWLEKQGFEITYLGVDGEGFVDLKELKDKIREDTILVSIMYANNEIGTIEPIEEIGKICKEKGVCFHTDAVQAFGKIPIKLENIDLLSVSSHKINGPKGVGFLFVRKGTKIDSLLHGGEHEFGLRSGTENLPGIIGFAKAAELSFQEKEEESARQIKLRDKLIEGLSKIEEAHLTGPRDKRLPNNVNFYFKFIEGESLITHLDLQGIAASTGSACSSSKLEASHVLLAIGLAPACAHGSCRLTLGKQITEEDIDYALKIIPEVVEKLRRISPLKDIEC